MRMLDFHVHLFPEALAGRTLQKLAHTAADERGDAPYFTDGTRGDTLRRMAEWGVDSAVTQHIATSVHAMHKVNDFAASVRGGRLYAFGSVHPDAPDALEELERIKALGLDGVKFHPDYQGFAVDESRMAPIYEKMLELGLPVLFHAGWDPLSGQVCAPPERLRQVVDGYPRLTVIAAHLGGMRCYDRVETHLLGRKNLYLDTAMTYPYLHDAQQYARILRGHGLERVLFATDCPWSTPERELRLLDTVGMTGQERQGVLYGNALRLLDEPLLGLCRVDEVSPADIYDFAAEFDARGEHIIAGGDLDVHTDIEAWVQSEKRMEREETLPRRDWVPGTTFFSTRRSDGRIVGVVNVRHWLNEGLRRTGGHIGYSIRPSERRKGYAKEQLRLALRRAEALCREEELLITCDRENLASAATIRALGGALGDEIARPDGGVTQRYWVKKG